MKLPMKYSYKNVLEWGIFNHTEAHYYLVAVTPSLSNYVSYFCRVLFIVPVFNLIFYYCTVCINMPIIAEMDILNRFMPELIILFSSQLTWAFYKECEGMSCWRGRTQSNTCIKMRQFTMSRCESGGSASGLWFSLKLPIMWLYVVNCG